ncbi:MAG: hypothetical protein JO197_21535 [Acidobacteria bacterium]|nr:hypothetical protein [Acidobacteriota bacterium]MBV9475472.1 hypothetical protein [Acidobacteriota bacterium]
MNLERDLTRALRRTPPPPGFAGRVMQRIEREGVQARRVRPVWWRAAAASLTLAALLGGYTAHHVIEQRRGEHARDQVLLAMRIAGAKMRYARQQVHGIGSER